MIIQARFGVAQTGLGYQFYDDAGTLLSTRITAGIATLPETGAYIADATVPVGSVGVFWDSTETPEGATEDLREAFAAGLSPETIALLDGADQILLNEIYTPTGSPAVVVPDPVDDLDLCRVYVNSEDLTNQLLEGVTVTFRLSGGPAKSERLLRVDAEVTMTTDAAGYAYVDLQRNDLLTPNDTYYRVTCTEFGLRNVTLPSLNTAMYNLADLIL